MSELARLYSVKGLPQGTISIMPRPRGGDWLADEIALLQADGVDTLVSLLTSEEVSELDLSLEADVCETWGILYRSYPIPDHTAPPFAHSIFVLLEELTAQVEQGKHVAAHCRMGLGRSALIVASVLVLSGFMPERACQVLSQVRGYQVPEMEVQRAWLRELPRRYQEYRRLKQEQL